MATLYVENVPDDLYQALRNRAKQNGKSITAEVLELLRQFVPTEEELARRRELFEFALRVQAQPPLTTGPHNSVEEMLREDRDR